MELKLQLTARDKKLLFFLAIFLIVVVFGWWGIRPVYNSLLETQDALTLAEEEKIEKEEKMMMLPTARIALEQTKENLAKSTKNYYDVMQSQQIDALLTGIVLDYGLSSHSLSIGMPEGYTTLKPYIGSELAESFAAVAAEAKSEETDGESGDGEAAEDEGEDTGGEDSEATDAEGEDDAEQPEIGEDGQTVMAGIYAVDVTMKIYGGRDTLQRLLNDLANSYPAITVKSFTWAASSNAGGTVLGYELNIQMQVYMYEGIDQAGQ